VAAGCGQSVRDVNQLRDYYQQEMTPHAAQGVSRQMALEALARVDSRILKSLAERCLKRTHVKMPPPDAAQPGDWCSPITDLLWGHLKDAGRSVPSIGVIYSNLVPLRTSLERWARDGSRHRWNLCDNAGVPLEWVASAAVDTLNIWRPKKRLPKTLTWLDCEMHSYFAAPVFEMQRLVELELEINDIRRPRLSYRAQRKAEREYKSLAKDLNIQRMPRMSLHYFEWYALRTFLGLDLRDIRKRTRANVGSATDHSALSHGIRKVGDLVGFHRQ